MASVAYLPEQEKQLGHNREEEPTKCTLEEPLKLSTAITND
jgi:hypothetical protein